MSSSNNTELVVTNTLKNGDIVLIDGSPCKILKYSSAKTGKHGSSKTMFDCRNLLSGKNVQTFAPTKGTMEVPVVMRETFTVIGISYYDYLTLMRNGKLREDVICPNDEIGEQIRSLLGNDKTAEIVLMTVLDHNLILSARESSDV